jgi:transcription elongation factor
MKNTLRLGVLSALIIGSMLPAYSQPSNADMGFASSREPTINDAGGAAVVRNVQGYGGSMGQNNSFAGSELAGANNGEETGNTTYKTKAWYFDAQQQGNVINPQDRRPDSQGQSQTNQRQAQMMTSKNVTEIGNSPMDPFYGSAVSTSLLAPNSTSDVNFRGPQHLGFRAPSMWTTPYAARRMIMLPRTGTGSVDITITSRDGKNTR